MALDPRFLATAVEAALAAGRIQRKYFRRPLDIVKKGPIDLVTAADLEVEQTFRALIAARFPSHVVLGEEQAGALERTASGYRWIIDPVDGTTNFVHGLALFCVSIGLEVDGRVDLGVVYDPMGEELFTAERGEGARLNGQRLAVTSSDQLIDALLVTGFPYNPRAGRQHQVDVFRAFLERSRAVRRLGSAALDLCYVAAGRFDAFWEDQLHAWDIAAGALIVAEAGGRVTDYAGAPVELTRGQIVASNAALHARMLETILAVRTIGVAIRRPWARTGLDCGHCRPCVGISGANCCVSCLASFLLNRSHSDNWPADTGPADRLPEKGGDMWRARASTRGWVLAGALVIVLTCGATAASAQVVQSVQLGAGVFFPRGFDTRVPGDTLVADLADANPLFFEISDFTGGTIFGEWNVSFGPHIEAGAGIGYYKRTVHSVYRNLVNTDGTEIRQDLRLRITPITGVVRFLPFGTQAELQPYIGVGVGAFNFRYSEVGQFVDPSDFSVFVPNPPYTVTGTAVGPIVLGGLRIPIKGDIYAFSTEYRYQWASGNTGGINAGFLGPKIDLSGGSLNFAFLIRF